MLTLFPQTQKHDEIERFPLSVILPAYNEEGNIQRSIARVLETISPLNGEVVVVDDGSTDSTYALAMTQALANSGRIRVLSSTRNSGKGHAVLLGSKFASGRVIVFLDSDLEIASDDLRSYLLELTSADVAIASKRHPFSAVRVPRTRRVLSEGFHIIVRLLTGLKVSDTQSGLKAIRASSLQRMAHLLSVKKYAFDVELLTVAQLLGLRIVELPVRMNVTGLFSLRNAARMFIDVLGIAYRLRIIRWYQANLSNSNAVYESVIRW